MNTNPTLSELIASFTATLGRVETILDRMEARERNLDALIEKFNAVFPDEDEADIQWAPADPAPGHPELPLAVAVQMGKTESLSDWAERSIAACTPKVQLNQLPTVAGEGPAVDLAKPRKNPSGPDRIAVTELDPTMRDLPMPTDWPPLPPLPEGKTRWVNRGDFRNEKPQAAGGRHVRYFSEIDDAWVQTLTFSGAFIHIEAVAEPVDELPDNRPAITPRVGQYYYLRIGKTGHVTESAGDQLNGKIHTGGEWLPYHWHLDGRSMTDPGYDIVELCPF